MTKPTNKAQRRVVKRRPVQNNNNNNNNNKIVAKQASWQRQLLTGALSTVGSVLGPAGSNVGMHLGNLIANWRGYGAYNVSKNSLFTAPVPAMHSSNETTVIRHREYITDIQTSATANTFALQTFALNPGLVNTFPWLASVASQYQEYKMRGCVFEFVSTSADALNSVNTALGTVIIASRYRANSAPFNNKLAMLNEYFSCDGKPSCNFVHPIECNPRESPSNLLYIRDGLNQSTPGNDDLKWYDLCEVDVATNGFQGTSVVVGELWVSYEVELLKPQLAGGATDAISAYAHYGLNTASAAAYYGTSRFVNTDTIGLTFTTSSVSFPFGTVGTFMVLYNVYFSGGPGNCTVPALAFTNCTFTINGFTNVWANSSQVDIIPGLVGAGTMTNGLNRAFFVQLTQADAIASLTLSGGVYPSGGFGDLVITQVPSSFAGGSSL
jgi:hypothetical protein